MDRVNRRWPEGWLSSCRIYCGRTGMITHFLPDFVPSYLPIFRFAILFPLDRSSLAPRPRHCRLPAEHILALPAESAPQECLQSRIAAHLAFIPYLLKRAPFPACETFCAEIRAGGGGRVHVRGRGSSLIVDEVSTV